MKKSNYFVDVSWGDIEIRRIYNPLQGDYRKGYYELDLVERGKVEAYYGKGMMELPSGTFLLACSDETLYMRAASVNEPVSILQMRFSKDYFPQDFLKLRMCASLKPFMEQIVYGVYGDDAGMYSELCKGISRMNEASAWGQYELLFQLLVGLSKADVRIFPSMRWLENGNFPVDSVVGKANMYMKEHISDIVRLEELARSAGVTVPSFCRFYKKKTGMSPLSYLKKLRIETACALLEDTDKTIKEISLECGYSDPSFFMCIFKREVGMTMSQYRERKR